tara:strand:+ start:829 stop:1059 length:231 start_codon:yes stop_codon:yes gene_type:complete
MNSKFKKDEAFWANKISDIKAAIAASKIETSILCNKLETCFDEESKRMIRFQLEARESQDASFKKELRAAKERKFF